MNENKINVLVEDTLNSIDDLKRPVPGDHLFQRILNRYHENDKSLLKENNYIGKYAVAFAVLVILNIFTLFNFKSRHENNTVSSSHNYINAVNEFTKTYFSETEEYSYNK